MANALRKVHPDCELLYIGGWNNIEERLAGGANIPFEGLKTRKMKKLFSLDSFAALWALGSGFFRARQILLNFKPDIVIGTGGYASAAVCIANLLLGGKTLIHEQNAIPGRTNLCLGRFVTRVCVTFESSVKYFPASRTVVTGLPIRDELLDLPMRTDAAHELGINPNLFTLFVYGGSQGSAKLNQVVIESLPRLEEMHVQVLHQTGERNFSSIQELKSGAKFQNYHIYPYFDDSRPAFAVADLMLSRCGASTIAEITALGIPSIYVPYPYAYANHQYYNAKFVVDNGGGVLIDDRNLNANVLTNTVAKLMNSADELARMRESSKKLGKPDAAYRIVTVIDDILSK